MFDAFAEQNSTNNVADASKTKVSHADEASVDIEPPPPYDEDAVPADNNVWFRFSFYY